MTDDHGRFRAVFEAAPDAMLLADDEGRYIDANRAACRLLQRTVEQLRRLTVADVTPEGVRVQAAWREFLARASWGASTRCSGPTGRPWTWSSTRRPT